MFSIFDDMKKYFWVFWKLNPAVLSNVRMRELYAYSQEGSSEEEAASVFHIAPDFFLKVALYIFFLQKNMVVSRIFL